MAAATALVCMKCGKSFGVAGHITCPDCGLEGILDVEYDYDEMKSSLERAPLKSRTEGSMWRYADMLPTRGLGPRSLRVGWTPLYHLQRLGLAVGHDRLYLKDDTLNPSASLKDRASAVAVSMALEQGAEGIACASTGNAASSLAVISASVGLKSYIFVPKTIPKPKLYQLAACAERVFRVNGTYEVAFDLATEAINKWGWANRNCGINPYLVEGKKTCSLEIYEQLGRRVPDWVVVPMGDGCIMSGQAKAFRELRLLKETSRLPRLLGVQAEGARPIVDAFLAGGDVRPVAASTFADSIRVGEPRNWRKALRGIRESDGAALGVTDGEIADAMLSLGRNAGVFAEPAGATGFAGFLKARRAGLIGKDDTVVVLVTGSGLKDPESLSGRSSAADVEGTLDSVEQALSVGRSG
jgi:threonine synthase